MEKDSEPTARRPRADVIRMSGRSRQCTRCPTVAPVERDYSATPLAQKLGVGPEMTVATLGAPAGAVDKIGALPPGCRVIRRLSASVDLILWWPRDAVDLERRAAEMAGRAGLWILWPKRSSGLDSDLTDQVVREAGLATGLVDNKVAAFDDTWSALRFVPRRPAK